MMRSVSLAVVVSLAVGCATVSQQQEIAIGQQNARQIDQSLPVVRDSAITAYLNALGDSMARLTPRGDLDWHFAVVNAGEVNAFALLAPTIGWNRVT